MGQTSKAVETGGYLYLIHPTDRRENVGEVHGAHILVQFKEGLDTAAAHARIDSIYDILQANKSSFENLAKKHSDCPSAAKGGDLDWFGRGQMVPEFDSAVFAMNVGEISEPVKTQFGYHLIKLTAKNEAAEVPFEQVKPQLMQSLLSEKQRNAYNSKINQLKIMFPVDIF